MKRVFLLILLLATGVVCAFLVSNKQIRAVDAKQVAQKQRQVAHWSRGDYIPITDHEGLRAGILDRVQACDTNGLLSPDLRAKLTASILAMCRAYSDADFDAFVEFRLPAPDNRTFAFLPDKMAERAESLPDYESVVEAVRAGRRKAVDRPVSLDTSLGVLEAWWYAKAPHVVGFEGELLFCMDSWKEFSLERFNLFVEERRGPVAQLFRIANRLTRVGSLVEINSMLTVTPSVEELLQEGKPVLFAHCLVPVKLARRIAARPVLVSFYWSAAQDKFLPHRLGVLGSDLQVYYVF